MVVGKQGQILKDFLQLNRISQREFCSMVKANPSNFDVTFLRENINAKYISRIKEVYGLDFDDPQTWQQPAPPMINERSTSHGDDCEARLKTLETLLAEKERVIQAQEKLIARLEKLLDIN